MLFSSIEFLYLFLPLTIAVYFLFPLVRWKNHVLLGASLIFYGIAQPTALPLMLAVSLTDFYLGLAVHKALKKDCQKRARRLTAAAVVSNVATLAVFKYLDPLLSALGLPTFGIALPVGISFYIFQALSYVLDVHREETAAQSDPLTFTTYVTLFPQLVAGPIVRYGEVDSALSSRSHSLGNVADGLRLFCVGLAKKCLLSVGATEGFDRMLYLSNAAPTSLGAWLGLMFYAFRIYFDFSGYSDMAKGLGRIFGFEFPQNFRYPYIAESITDFWRRWHITLSEWFKKYVYIPLGGNRRGKTRTYLNLFTVWSLTGLWHGASLNFVLWGLYFFLLLALEKSFVLRLLERLPRLLRHVYSLFFILIGWLIFFCDGSTATLSHGAVYLGQLFGIGCRLASSEIYYELLRNLPFLIILTIGSTPFATWVTQAVTKKYPTALRAISGALSVAAIIVSTCYLVASGYDPFLYFKF